MIPSIHESLYFTLHELQSLNFSVNQFKLLDSIYISFQCAKFICVQHCLHDAVQFKFRNNRFSVDVAISSFEHSKRFGRPLSLNLS